MGVCLQEDGFGGITGICVCPRQELCVYVCVWCLYVCVCVCGVCICVCGVLWSDMGQPKCGKPLTLVLRQMDIQRQSDDQDAKRLVSDRSKHTKIVNHLIDH